MCAFIRRLLAAIAITVSILALLRVVRRVDSGSRRTLVRRFNKHILNPFALWVVAHRRTYYGVLHHVGRHSGKPYNTPVVAKLTAEGIIIPLPYGADTDWCRNVLAAGGGTLTLNGEDYTLGSPQLIDASVAEPLVPAVNARVWRGVGIKQYLSFKTTEQHVLPVAESTVGSLIGEPADAAVLAGVSRTDVGAVPALLGIDGPVQSPDTLARPALRGRRPPPRAARLSS
jgi:deazaflavin-dependent oxidoreductase (nitroreductase family)